MRCCGPSRRLRLLALALMMALSGCEGMTLPSIPGLPTIPELQPARANNAPAGTTPGATTPAAAPAGEQASAPPATTPAAPPAAPPERAEAPTTVGETVSGALPRADMSSHVGMARRELQRNFMGFLRRDSLGFDATLWAHTVQDAQRAPSELARFTRELDARGPLSAMMTLFPTLIILAALALLMLMDAQMMRLAHRWQVRVHIARAPWSTRALRVGLLLSGALLAPTLVLALSYFPVRAIFGERVWTVALTDLLWAVLAYRALRRGAQAAFGLMTPWLADKHAEALMRSLRHIAVMVMGVAVPMILIESAAVSPEVGASYAEGKAFAGWMLRVALACAPLLLFNRRDDVMALMPPHGEGQLYDTLRNALKRNFRWVLVVTALLLMMHAFGYRQASSFLLWRGYGLFFLLLAGIRLVGLTRRAIETRAAKIEGSPLEAELLLSTRGLITVALVLLIATSALKLLTLYEPLILLLKAPLLSIRTVDFSIFNVLSAITLVAVSALISKLLRIGLSSSVYPKLSVDMGVAYAVNTLVNYLIVVIGFFMVLVALGVNLGALTVVAASLSVGIGFGLQTLTENLISGFIILFGRAVRKGDYVTVNEVYGRIEAVGARSVVVRTPDNYDLLIPSKEIIGGTIINWTYRDSIVRLRVPVRVSYEAAPHEVEQVLLKAAAQHPEVRAQPAPEVWFVGFDGSAINFQVLVHFDCARITSDKLIGRLNYLIWDELKAAKIEIPYHQRDLHIRSAAAMPEITEALRHIQRERSARQGAQPRDEARAPHDAVAPDEEREQPPGAAQRSATSSSD